MSILFSGALHANISNEMLAIMEKTLVKKFNRERYETIRYHIMLGDASFLRSGEEKNDKALFSQLSERPFPVLSVVGDTDPILGMDNVPETDIGIGEKVLVANKANPFVAYLKRGKVYTIDGFRFLVLGGALSPYKTIWEREYWTEQEKRDLFKLIANDNTFDFVLSHTGPHHVNKLLFPDPLRFDRRTKIMKNDRFVTINVTNTEIALLETGEEVLFREHLFEREQKAHNNRLNDEVAFLNDEIHTKIQFREWWCGHWYKNKYHCDEATGRGYQYLHGGTRILSRQDGGMVVYSDVKNETMRKVQ